MGPATRDAAVAVGGRTAAVVSRVPKELEARPAGAPTTTEDA